MNHLEKILNELTIEAPNNLLVSISDKVFNLESNTVTQGQCNTIIKLLVKTLEKIERLEKDTIRIINRQQDPEYIDRLIKRIDLIEKRQGVQPPSSSQDIKDILGPKVNLPDKHGISKKL